MRVAAVQFRNTPGDLVTSRERLASLVSVVDATVDLMVFPEMAVCGYDVPDKCVAQALAEPADGETVRACAEWARRCASWAVIGFAERAGDEVYNSAAVLDPGGQLFAVYRKRLLFEADLAWASPGDRPWPLFEVRGRAVTTGICMDLNDDEFIEWIRRSRAEVVAFPTQWVQEDLPVVPYWQWRLWPGTTTLIAANGYGPQGPWNISGGSAVLDILRVHSRAPATGDRVVYAEI